MTDSPEDLQRKIKQASDLGAVVKTMKAITASNIGQYQKAVKALDAYYKTILLGVQVYLRHEATAELPLNSEGSTLLIVFGSDQGLVGPFNRSISSFATKSLSGISGNIKVWAVGERVQYLLEDAKLNVTQTFHVPSSIKAVTALTGQLLIDIEKLRKEAALDSVYAVYNRPQKVEAYTPVLRKLLPFDEEWKKRTDHKSWPSKNLPQILGSTQQTFSALFGEYLFTSLYRACAYSLASENTSRLHAMQLAEKNIEELRERLNADYHQLRQDTIDAELFDIVSGFNAMKKRK